MNFEYVMFNQCAINNQSVVHVTYPPSNLMFGSGSIVGNDDPLGGQGHNGVGGGGGLLVTAGLLVAAGLLVMGPSAGTTLRLLNLAQVAQGEGTGGEGGLQLQGQVPAQQRKKVKLSQWPRG